MVGISQILGYRDVGGDHEARIYGMYDVYIDVVPVYSRGFDVLLQNMGFIAN